METVKLHFTSHLLRTFHKPVKHLECNNIINRVQYYVKLHTETEYEHTTKGHFNSY